MPDKPAHPNPLGSSFMSPPSAMPALQPQRPLQPTQPQQPSMAPPPYQQMSMIGSARPPPQPQLPQPPPVNSFNPVIGLMPPQYPEDPKVVAARNSKAALTSRAQSHLREIQKELQGDIEKHMLESSNYEDTTTLLEQMRANAIKDRDQLTGTLAILTKQTADLARWLQDNEKGSEADPSVDDLTEPSDPRLKQLFNLRAEDAALEDVQYWLDRALKADRIDIQSFLKSTRSNASDQFLKRALMKKIQDAVGIRPPNVV